MTVVYVLRHVHIINDDEEDVKMIGIYSTKQLAQEVVERLREQPGFCDTPDGFCINGYELNQDHWTEGYITVYPSDFDSSEGS